jgi:uncharacterized protein (DUF934 family)
MEFLTATEALPAGALQLTNTDDVLARGAEIRRHAAVVLQFPKWTDGRAYSQAVLLRGRLRYGGRLVASGDVVADMAPLLRRCGFDSARLREDQRRETALRALGHVDAHYQVTLAERRDQPAQRQRADLSSATAAAHS